MRSAEQISRTVEEWHDYQRAQREQTLRASLRELAAARERRDEWYVWVSEGQPTLTQEEYDRVGRFKKGRKRG